jgi:hypothetical protein
MAQKLSAMRHCREREQYFREQKEILRNKSLDYKPVEKQEEHYLEQAIKDHLPSGSGFDSGVKLIDEKSSETKLCFTVDFHHMGDNGYYIYWTKHTVTVTPLFGGINIKVSGVDKRQIKEYIAETFHSCLDIEVNNIGARIDG